MSTNYECFRCHYCQRQRKADVSLQMMTFIHLNSKLAQLKALLHKIFDLANNDLLLSNTKTGLNDYSMSENFIKKLQDTSNVVSDLADHLNKQAVELQDKIDSASDRKCIASGIICVEEVTDPKQKCPEACKHDSERFKPSSEFRLKRETISDSDSENDGVKEPVSGELDGHFAYPKDNENPAEGHNFLCDHFDKIFRDQHELRNHYTNHKIEFYTCLVCDKLFRSVQSFEIHRQSHPTLYMCTECSKTFKLKTSLTNHAQVHSNEQLACSHNGCKHTFHHRQNHLEHVKWGHRDNKECPCNVCGKMFQMPTHMRMHRVKKHGYVEELLPGHPYAEHARKCRLDIVKKMKEK